MADAWLITWEGTRSPHGKIAAVFNYRKKDKTVAEFMEQLYCAFEYTDADKVRFADHPRENPYRSEIENFGRINCGHNPYLYGRCVSNIRVEEGAVCWDEPPSVEAMKQKIVIRAKKGGA